MPKTTSTSAVRVTVPCATGAADSMSALARSITATSAVCVTGLIVVDTPVYWTGGGHAIILALIQLGGFGIMSFASLLGLLLARRMGLRSRVSAAAETRSVGFGDVRNVLLGVLRITLVVEFVTAVVLAVLCAAAGLAAPAAAQPPAVPPAAAPLAAGHPVFPPGRAPGTGDGAGLPRSGGGGGRH